MSHYFARESDRARAMARWVNHPLGVCKMKDTFADWNIEIELPSAEVADTIETHFIELMCGAFNPPKVDAQLKKYMHTDWIERGIKHFVWRKLLLHLHARYPDCMTLQIARRKMVQAGYSVMEEENVKGHIFWPIMNQAISVMEENVARAFGPKGMLEAVSIMCSSKEAFMHVQPFLTRRAIYRHHATLLNNAIWLHREVFRYGAEKGYIGG